MTPDAGPQGRLDWTAGDLREGTLTLPLVGEVTSRWVRRLAGVLSEHPHDERWGRIEVTRRHVRIAAVTERTAGDLYDVLEDGVDRTNASFADAPADGAAGAHASTAVSLGLIALAVLALVVQGAGDSPVRPAVVLAFVAVGPGWAILRLVGLATGWIGAALVLAVSIALAALVAGVLLYAGAWSPFAALAVLAGITVAAAVAALAGVAGRLSR